MGSTGKSSENEEKKKKKLLIPIIIIISVLLLGGTAGILAATGVFKGQEPTESETEVQTTEVETSTEEEQPENSDVALWWNIDRLQYAGQSEIGTSSRQPDKTDGYYHVLFAYEGRQVTRRIAEKKLLNVIDGNDLMGLRFDENGIVCEVLRVEDFTGGFEINGWYVSGVDAESRTVTVNSAINLEGIDVDYVIPKEAMIFDVSGAEEYVGNPVSFANIREKDKLFAVKNLDGDIYRVFIVDRYVTPQIYWNVERMYDSELLQTTRVPNADGDYEILMAHDGEQVLLKCKDRTKITAIDKIASKNVCLKVDENGYIEKVTATSTAIGPSFGSWYRVQAIDGRKVTAMEASVTASAFGKIQEANMADNCHVYDVSTTAEFVGIEVNDLKVSDQIHGVKNSSGEIVVIYIIKRKSDSLMYWSMARKYDSKTKQTTRVKGDDGYYHFELACEDGKVRDFKTKDKELATKFDAYAARSFGMKVSGNVMLEMYDAASVYNGMSFGSWYYVTSVKNGEVTCQSKDPRESSEKGTVRTAKLAKNARIINVSGIYKDHKGEYTTLMTNDKIQGWTNWKGEIEVIYVHQRKYADKVMYCPICDKEVTHTATAGALNAQKDKSGNPLAITHYYVPQSMTLSAQGTTAYSSEVKDGKTVYTKTSDVHLNINGKTLQNADEKRLLAQFGPNAELYVFDTAEKKGTLKVSNTLPTTNGSAFWTMSSGSKMVFKDVTIDISAVTGGGNYGAFYCGYNSTWEFDNCKIIAPKAAGPNGSIFQTYGSIILRDTEITGGVAESKGTIYMMSVNGKLYIEGNTKISGGKLTDGTPANIYLTKGALIYTETGITSEDGSICVSPASEGVFTSTGFEGLASKFKSDVEGGIITEKDGKLSLEYVVTGVAFEGESVEVEVGEAKKFAAKTTPVSKDGVKIVYESSDPESVQVNSDGTVIGVKETASPVTVTAKVTVGDETYTDTATVSVTAATKQLDHYHAEATAADIAADKGAKVNYTAWTSATALPTEGGYYYLTQDVQLSGQYSMAANVNLHICLNGHKIIGATTGGSSRAISLHNAGCELGICDCSEGTVGQIVAATTTSADGEGEKGQGRAVWVRYGTFNFYGGTIIGSKTSYSNSTYALGGGAVYVASGTTFNMYDGTIKDGIAIDTSVTTGANGGGGNVGLSGTMNMYGGVIENGVGGHGANLYVREGTLNMYGGTIRGGYAGYEYNASGELVQRKIVDPSTNKSTTWRCGGNIYISGNATKVNLYGGSIENGTALGAGGNIMVSAYNDALKIQGTEEAPFILTGGHAMNSYGGNIASDKSYSYSIEYATVSDGQSKSSGANIYGSGPSTTLKNITVSGGSGNNGQIIIGNGVNVLENVKMTPCTMTGGADEKRNGLVVRKIFDDLPVITIKDCELSTVYVEAADSMTLDGKCVFGTTEIPGLVLSYQEAGDKITLADTFSAESKISVNAGGMWTVISNGASKIDCFTQTMGDEYELAADGAKLVLQAGTKHKHCVCGTDDVKVGEHTCEEQVWQEWTSTSKLPNESGYFVLVNDVQLTSQFSMNANVKLHICLNGHKISGAKTGTSVRAISLHNTGCELSICDCSEAQTGTIEAATTTEGEGEKAQGRAVWVRYGTFNLYGGTIIGSRTTYAGSSTTAMGGASVYVPKNATFNMYGGVVKDGYAVDTSVTTSANGGGGNIGITGTMNMYGGTVKDGVAGFGGNIYIRAGVLNMYGGTISGGYAGYEKTSGGELLPRTIVDAANGNKSTTWRVGGNIYISKAEGTAFNMYGGVVENGHALGQAGNIMVSANNALNIKGTAENPAIIRNGVALKSSGGNISTDTSYELSIENAEITGGTAKNYGANLYIAGPTSTLKNVKISGGSSDVYANVYITNGAVTLENVTITDVTIGGTQSKARTGLVLNASSGKTLNATIKGGEISKVAVMAANAVTLDGTPKIDEIALASGKKITLGATFAARTGAPIGISMEAPGVFTTNEGNPEDFRSVNETLHVEKNTDNNLFLTEGQVPEVELSASELTLYIGKESEELTATPNELAEAFTVATWTSSDETVATVVKDSTNQLKATVTRLKEGEVTITVTLQLESDTVSQSCAVTCLGNDFHKHCICGGTIEDGTAVTETLTHTCSEVQWTKWTSTSTLPTYDDLQAGDNYFFLANDIQLTEYWAPGKSEDGRVEDMNGRNIIICLNGHTVKAKAATRLLNTFVSGNSSSTYKYTKNVNITITDCCETPGSMKISGTYSSTTSGQMFFFTAAENAKLTIYNGIFDGSEADGKATAGGLFNFTGKNAEFNLYGGTLTGGKAIAYTQTDYTKYVKDYHYTSWGGGNVYMTQGTFNMYGGKIENGQALHSGGNVLMGAYSATVQPTFNMYGGEITGGKVNSNSVTVSGGGNVFVAGDFNMYGGKITNGEARENVTSSKNTKNAGYYAQGYGGNLFIGCNTATIYSGEITGGRATYGGNIAIKGRDTATPTTNVEILGGTVSGGVAYNGGGIKVEKGRSTTVNVTIGGTAVITANTGSSKNAVGVGLFADYGNIVITGQAKISGNNTLNTNFVGDDIYRRAEKSFSIEFKEYTGTDPIYIGNGNGDGGASKEETLAIMDADYRSILRPAKAAYELQKDGTSLNYVQK